MQDQHSKKMQSMPIILQSDLVLIFYKELKFKGDIFKEALNFTNYIIFNNLQNTFILECKSS